MSDVVPRSAQIGDQPPDADERRLERVEAGELAADMERNAAQFQAGQPREPVEYLRSDVDADAELVFGLAGRNLGVGACVDVGIDAQHRLRGDFLPRCDLRERDAFGFMFDVELADAAVETERQLGARLSDARKDDVFGRHPRRDRAFELAARHDVGAIALPREDTQHAEVGVALDREGNVLARNIGERVAKHLRMAFERRARIDIDGGADFLGNARQGDVFGVENAVTISKMIHGKGPELSPEAASRNRRVRAFRIV